MGNLFDSLNPLPLPDACEYILTGVRVVRLTGNVSLSSVDLSFDVSVPGAEVLFLVEFNRIDRFVNNDSRFVLTDGERYRSVVPNIYDSLGRGRARVLLTSDAPSRFTMGEGLREFLEFEDG